ncbi:hypothetical protein [Sphingomonas sp.]|jgi:hypothetical protein|uniref:hypothetical protein n=1 Tax=Sphingomonas sp. TaxID=28214 RepID=UPI002ED9E0CB
MQTIRAKIENGVPAAKLRTIADSPVVHRAMAIVGRIGIAISSAAPRCSTSPRGGT